MILADVFYTVFTLLAAFWARCELQAFRYTPWYAKHDQKLQHSHTSGLDYTDMMLPMAIFRSLQNRHFLVSFTAFTSIAIKLQIILSSSMFLPLLTERTESVDVQVLDSFIADWSDSTRMPIDFLAYQDAVNSFGIGLPFGVSNEGSYETFTLLDSRGSPARVRNGESLTVSVDGFFMDTTCLLLSKWTSSEDDVEFDGSDRPGIFQIDIELEFDGCEAPHETRLYSASPGHVYPELHLVEKGNPYKCSSLPEASSQIVHYVAHISPSGNDTKPHVTDCAAVLCSSSAWTASVDILDNETDYQVLSTKQPTEKTAFDIDPTKVLFKTGLWDDYISSDLEKNNSTGDLGVSGPPGSKRNPQADSRRLEKLIHDCVRDVAPITAHSLFRRSGDHFVVGSLKKPLLRLTTNIGICASMATASLSAAIFAFLTFLYFQKTCAIYFRDPATTMGAIVQLYRNPEVQTLLATTTDSREETVRSMRAVKWRHILSSPLILLPLSRSALLFYVCSLVILFSITLQRSNANEGLLTTGFEDYWPLVWQSLPTLAFLIISLYSTSSDAAVRNLSLLQSISSRPHSADVMDTSLTDMLGLRALWKSIKLGIPAVSISQILALMCSFLPILSSILLIPTSMPKTTPFDAVEDSWFGTRSYNNDNFREFSENRRRMKGLNAGYSTLNFTSPRNTYRDLLFPSFRIDAEDWGQGRSARVSIPGAKLIPTCDRLTDNDFRFRYEPDSMAADVSIFEDNFETYVDQNFTCPNGSTRSLATYVTFAGLSEENAADSLEKPHPPHSVYYGNLAPNETKPFGISWPSPFNPLISYRECNEDRYPNKTSPPWFMMTYLWGALSSKHKRMSELSLWQCNYTWMSLDTDLTLKWSGGEAAIDHTYPPSQLDTEAHPWLPPFNVPVFDFGMLENEIDDSLSNDFESAMVDLQNQNLGVKSPTLSPEFLHIMEPYGRNRLDDLWNPEHVDRILQDLVDATAFTAAQLANTEQRLSFDETSDTIPRTAPSKENRRVFNGTITDSNRQRLVQDANITITLLSILGLVIIIQAFVLISGIWRQHQMKPDQKPPWLLDLEMKGVAPPAHNSMAMMAALLEGSNCGSVIPLNAHLMPPAQLHECLKGIQFRLGWFHDTTTGEDVYTIGVLGDESFVFKGHVADAEKAQELSDENST